MKKYMLKKWYPSLKKTIKIGSVVSKIYNCGGYNYRGSDSEGNVYYVGGGEVENNPDFWELIEEEKPKPLFITEDGVDKFYSNQPLWEVNKDFEKLVTTVAWVASKGSKYFSHEGNADKYIEDNKPKPLFVTEDGVECFDKDDYIAIGSEFEKRNMSAYNYDAPYSSDVVRFKHESNADEYIWRNMRLFSYEDVVEWYGYGFKLGREGIYETLERLAIERSKE